MVARNLDIKLSVKDADVIRRALAGVGKDGEAALKKIEAAAHPASAKLKLVDAAAAQTRAGFERFAARAGPIGEVIGAIGPRGLAAAAGIGAVAVGVGVLTTKALAAIKAMDDLDDSAAALGVGTGYLQSIRFAAQQLGSDAEETNGALEKLTVNLGDIGRGEGESALKAFARLGINVRNSAGEIRTIQDLLPELADRLSRVASQNERNSIAQDLFGRGNVGFVRALQGGSDALEENIRLAREMGAVVDEEMVRKGAAAENQLSALSQVIGANLNVALLDLAPVLVAGASLLAEFAKGVTDVAQTTKQEVEGILAAARSVNQWLEQNVIDLTPDSPDNAGTSAITGFRQGLPSTPQTTAGGKGNREATKEERDRIRKQLEDAADASKKHAEAIRDQIKALEFQGDQLGRTARQQEIYNELQRNGLDLTTEDGRRVAELAGKNFDRKKQIEDDTKAKEANVEAIKKITAAEIERQAVMDRRTVGAGIENAVNDFLTDAGDFAAMSEQVTSDFLGGMEDARAEFARTGKVSFSSLADAMIDDLSRISFKLMMSGILQWLQGGAASGGGGMLSGILGGLLGGGGIAGPHPIYGASGMAVDGSVISSPRSFRRGNRRGEVGENGPEGVLPLERTSDGRLGVAAVGGWGGQASSPQINFKVIDQRQNGEPVQQPRLGADGSFEIILRDIARQEATSVTGKMMRARGINAPAVRRAGG